MLNQENGKRGFTLVEIMIVIVIIGILMALALPALSRVRLTAQANTIARDMETLAGAAQAFILQNGEPGLLRIVSTGGITNDTEGHGIEAYDYFPPLLRQADAKYIYIVRLDGNADTNRVVVRQNTGGSGGKVLSPDLMREVDDIIDDGNLSTGFATRGGDSHLWYSF